MARNDYHFLNEIGPPEPPEAGLERAYILEYLSGQGYTLRAVLTLPAGQARKVRVEASIYASTHLAEVETRSRLVRNLRGEF